MLGWGGIWLFYGTFGCGFGVWLIGLVGILKGLLVGLIGLVGSKGTIGITGLIITNGFIGSTIF